MLKLLITSKNPVKINATRIAFEKMFPNESFELTSVSAESGVSDQPIGDEETITGAKNRVENAKKEISDADYYIGIEGGIEDSGVDVGVIAWTIIHSKDAREGKARAATFFLPSLIVAQLRAGKELARAVDSVFSKTNSGHQNGSVGILTHDVIDRTQYYVDMIVLALIPFVNEEMYKT